MRLSFSSPFNTYEKCFELAVATQRRRTTRDTVGSIRLPVADDLPEREDHEPAYGAGRTRDTLVHFNTDRLLQFVLHMGQSCEGSSMSTYAACQALLGCPSVIPVYQCLVCLTRKGILGGIARAIQCFWHVCIEVWIHSPTFGFAAWT